MTAEQADACHVGGWNDEEIAAFIARRERLRRWGYPAAEAESIAERLTLRNREQCDRRMCVPDCINFRRGICTRARAAGVGRELGALATIPQRCPAFVTAEEIRSHHGIGDRPIDRRL